VDEAVLDEPVLDEPVLDDPVPDEPAAEAAGAALVVFLLDPAPPLVDEKPEPVVPEVDDAPELEETPVVPDPEDELALDAFEEVVPEAGQASAWSLFSCALAAVTAVWSVLSCCLAVDSWVSAVRRVDAFDDFCAAVGPSCAVASALCA
jgi:hypothetical protein